MSFYAVIKKGYWEESTINSNELLSFIPYKTTSQAWQFVWKKTYLKLVELRIIPEVVIYLFEDYFKDIFIESGIAIPIEDSFDSDTYHHKHYHLRQIKEGEKVKLKDFEGIRLCDALDPNSEFSQIRSRRGSYFNLNESHLIVLQCAKVAKEVIEWRNEAYQALQEKQTEVCLIERHTLTIPPLGLSEKDISAVKETWQKEKERLMEEIKVLEKRLSEYFDETTLLRREMEAVCPKLKMKYKDIFGFEYYHREKRDDLIFNVLVIKHLNELGFDISDGKEMRSEIFVRDMDHCKALLNYALEVNEKCEHAQCRKYPRRDIVRVYGHNMSKVLKRKTEEQILEERLSEPYF